VEGQREWTIYREATVLDLLGIPAPGDRLGEWNRAWDEITDRDIEIQEDELFGAEGAEPVLAAEVHRKRPDGWAVNWGRPALFILEFTRPYDKSKNFHSRADTHKTEKYRPLKDRLIGLLPNEWEVDILTFTLGVRGSFHETTWRTNLERLGLTGARFERLMPNIISQGLTELNGIYKVRSAALANRSHAGGN
jgi:hypothetical protein